MLRAAIAAVALASLLDASSSVSVAAVPLPRPRPSEAPPRATVAEPPANAQSPEAGPQPPADAAAKPEPKPPEPSACRMALTETVAIAPSIPSIHGPGACGGDDLVRLEAVMLPAGRKVALKPAAVLRCTMATAIADWVRTDIEPLAASLGTSLSEVDNYDSYECRGRNRVRGAKLSEHGLANAIDIRGFRFANGTSISLTDRNAPREVLEKVLGSVCTRFATVLGPGSDWYHEEHIHLDLAERRNNYKLCQWGLFESFPAVAPLMPAVRPDEAPPRKSAEELAAEQKALQGGASGAPANAAPEGAEEEDGGKAAESKPAESKPATEQKPAPSKSGASKKQR